MTRIYIAIAAAVLSTGCLTIDSEISVQADGTGTLTHTLFLKSTTIESLKKFETTKENRNDAAGWKGFFSEAKWREASATMGEGVTFQSLQPLKKRGWEGVKVVYFFSDISKLTLKMGFPSVMSLTEPGPAPAAMTFRFAPAAAAPARLTIVIPPDRALDERTSGSPPETDGSRPTLTAPMAQFRPILDGFRASVAVDVGGPIVNTNANYVSGSKVIILAVDFNQMMSSGADFGMFGTAIDGRLPPDIREKLKTTTGLSMEVQPEVNVEFAPPSFRP